MRRSPCSARRHDRLVDVAEEAGNGAVAIRCDVTDEASCRDAIAEAADALGGIDGLVYATGIGPLAPARRSRRRHLAPRVRHQRHRRRAGHRRRVAAPHRVTRRGRVPLVGQRVTDPAVARPRRLRREQGRARAVGGGVPGRVPDRGLHPGHRRRVPGRRWARDDRIRQRVGIPTSPASCIRPGWPATSSPERCSRSRNWSAWSTTCCGVVRARRCPWWRWCRDPWPEQAVGSFVLELDGDAHHERHVAVGLVAPRAGGQQAVHVDPDLGVRPVRRRCARRSRGSARRPRAAAHRSKPTTVSTAPRTLTAR